MVNSDIKNKLINSFNQNNGSILSFKEIKELIELINTYFYLINYNPKTKMIKLFIFFLVIFTSCMQKSSHESGTVNIKNTSEELNDKEQSQKCSTQSIDSLFKEIHSYNQVANPYRLKDKRILSIRKLGECNNQVITDSLGFLFTKIDTTISGYWIYQSAIIETLATINSPSSIKMIGEIVSKYPLHYAIENHPLDFLVKTNNKNLKYLLPEFSKGLAIQKSNKYNIALFIGGILKKEHLSEEGLTIVRKYLVGYYEEIKRKAKSDPNSNLHELDGLLATLRYIKNDPTLYPIYKESLNSHYNFKNYGEQGIDYYKISILKAEILCEASIALIENNQEVEEKYIEKICMDPYYRMELYQNLKKINKLNLFPKKFISQYYFAESDLIKAYVTDSTNQGGRFPRKLEYLKKIKLTKGKLPGNYFVFKILYSEDGKRFAIFVSGPQPLEEEKVIEKGIFTLKDEYDTAFDEEQILKSIEKKI